MSVRSLADCDASCGGKAHGLARLIAAGLPVPDGFVIEPSVFAALVGDRGPLEDAGHRLHAAANRIANAELPAELVAEVDDRASALVEGNELEAIMVRSSATVEDTAVGAAPGVFESKQVPAKSIWLGIRGVWGSTLTPLAGTYADRGDFGFAVIVQRHVPGRLVTVYTRPPGASGSEEIWIQRGDRLEKLPRSSDDPIAQLAVRAERAIDARDGADVELVEGATTWIVQARPIVHPAMPTRKPPPPTVIASLVADSRTWTWDIAHNPDPLSTAQAGLVERVERAGVAPWSLRVVAGYLYSAPRGSTTAPISPAEVPVTTRAELEKRVARIEAAIDDALGSLPDRDGEHPELADAIERYVAFYRIWANDVVPLIRAARAALTPELLLGARPSAVEQVLLAAARGELADSDVSQRIGRMSPAWDVSVATFAESPFTLRHAITRARVHVAPPANERGERPADADHGVARDTPSDRDDLARAAADLAERDDTWFANAQWLVRSAILGRARTLGIDPDDAFWLPLDELAIAQVLDLDDARRRASATRAAAERASAWDMPLVVGGLELSHELLVGVGSGRASGRVVRLASLGARILVGRGDVVVTRAITPALAVIVVGCAAIVSESGGLLDHGAAMARELGIPFVVGCRGAWSQLSDGMLVTVDGDAGRVTT